MESSSGRRGLYVQMGWVCFIAVIICLVFSIRYIGEGYSKAQELMEDEMREFYSLVQSSAVHLFSPASGQLVAVRAEEEEEILRAQVCEIMHDKVKVRGHGWEIILFLKWNENEPCLLGYCRFTMWITGSQMWSAKPKCLSYMRSFSNCLSRQPSVNWQVSPCISNTVLLHEY